MFRVLAGPLGIAVLVGCTEGARVTRVSPEPGTTDVALTSEVAFRLSGAFDATDAFVQWNYSGSNGRLPARIDVSGRDLVVTPLAVMPDGALQDVWVHGLRTLSGADIPAIHTQFRAAFEVPHAVFAWQEGIPSGGGYRCDLLPDGRQHQCTQFLEGVGKDGLPATEDDVRYLLTNEYDGFSIVRQVVEEFGEVRATEFTYNEREIVSTVVLVDAGPDEQLDTDDDQPEMVQFSEFDEQGFLVATWNGNMGKDGLLGTRDDRIDSGVRYLTGALGQDLGLVEVRFHGSDEVVFYGWEVQRDAVGRFREGQLVFPGPDGAVGTEDDLLETLRWAAFDEEGRFSDFFDEDEDGFPQLWIEQVNDDSGRALRSIRRRPVDGRWPDPESDEGVYWYFECELQEGRRRSCRTVAEPGEDGIWLTDDDPSATTEEYAP